VAPRWELIERAIADRANIEQRRPPTAAAHGSAAPASLVAVASQPEMDTQVGDMEGPQVAVRTAVLDNLWLADPADAQGRPGGFQCLLIQGRCPAEYLALFHRTRLV
jgi:hypothetical protein